MKLPWGFYADVLCLVLTGSGLMLGVLLKSLEMVTYHVGIGLVMTWHLVGVVTKFANCKMNIGDNK